MDKFRNDLIRLGHELEYEHDRMFDLWTWLPSYTAAVAHHGDYYAEFMPTHHDILIETTMYLSDIKAQMGGTIQLTPEQLLAGQGFYSCPCDECDGQ